MCAEKVQVRRVQLSDCATVYEWLNDPLSKSMFFDGSTTSYEEHELWFTKSINNVNRSIFIGECNEASVGVSRFDSNLDGRLAEVSINMNPQWRGCGFGKKFLQESINCYLNQHNQDLVAKVKPNNPASLKIFNACGFETVSSTSEMILLRKGYKTITIKQVAVTDSVALFDLLKKRNYSISHQDLPTQEEHRRFVEKNPYRYWALVLCGTDPLGAFYLQQDNSIGLNLVEPTKDLLLEVLSHIRNKFKPLPELKSKVPPYFYINVSVANQRFIDILSEVKAQPIQTSFKI